MESNPTTSYVPLFYCVILTVALRGLSAATNGQELASNYYDLTCPRALAAIRGSVLAAVRKDRRMGASLLRMHFHDCFVTASDDTPSFRGEKTAGPNDNSLRGFEVIDAVKSQMESLCPGVVSCADIVAVAARDSVVALGGPTWAVQLGRKDSTDLPALISSFSDKGFTSKQLVALSGAHTIGHATCRVFRDRIHRNASSDIDASFADSLKSGCPPLAGSNDTTLSPLDAASPGFFDNAYFTNLIANQGLLHSDQQLFGGASTDAHVVDYAKRPRAFLADFAAAMVKMGSLGVITGTDGEVRANCRKING
ncbi:unnamed protein product [Linum tenue]|uniref:Peroxidase n=1 Tax=Linum tenue TaxID=586396 RepID=A0AAV0IRM8_9ROSI|nr:unnamed protein product [Linum tenue]